MNNITRLFFVIDYGMAGLLVFRTFFDIPYVFRMVHHIYIAVCRGGTIYESHK